MVRHRIPHDFGNGLQAGACDVPVSSEATLTETNSMKRVLNRGRKWHGSRLIGIGRTIPFREVDANLGSADAKTGFRRSG